MYLLTRNIVSILNQFIAYFILINASLFFTELQAKEGNSNFPSFLIQNFNSSELELPPQNWLIIQDQKEVIYIANHGSLLLFDGVSFTKVKIPNLNVRSLAIDKNGKVFVGGRSEIGYLSASINNEVIYKSLNNFIDDKDKNYSNVYRTFTTDDGVYFGSVESLIRWKDGNYKVWYPKTKFSLTHCVDNEIYIRENGVGLKKVVNDDLVLIEGGDKFAEEGIREILKIDGKLLLLSSNSGFMEYSGIEFSPFKTEIDDYLKSNRLFHACVLTDGNIAIATKDSGILIISQEGKHVASISKENGLQNNNVKYIFQDSQDNLWLALNDGISRVEYFSPLTMYNSGDGLNGIVLSLAKYQKKLFVGSTAGLYEQEDYSNLKFIKNNLIDGNIWSLDVFNDNLLVGTNLGLFEVNNNKVIEISSSQVYYVKAFSEGSKIYAGSDKGIEVFEEVNNSWSEKILFSEIDDRITSITLFNNKIWVGTVSKGLYSIPIDNNKMAVEYYDSTDGLPIGTINPAIISNRILAATPKGLFTFNSTKDCFQPDTTFGKMFADGSRGVFRILEDESGNVWIHSNSENFYAKLIDDSKYTIISKPFKRFEKKQINAILPDKNMVWFGAMHSEILRYDKTIEKDYSKPFNTLIRKVTIKGDSLIYGGAEFNEEYIPKSIGYEYRNFRFEYSATFFEATDRILYQYKLHGYDEEWSEWTNETKKDYTNLSEGKYEFEVRAKNVYEIIGNSGFYKFEINPPFYRTIIAYILYILTFIILVFLFIRIRLAQLKKEKEKLQQIINEKTEEVLNQNHILEEQAAQLKELDKVKSRFFANISHEFRTPLTLIIGPIEQMKNEEENESKIKKYSMILRNSKKLLGLINQLLDLSKLESGKIELRFSKLNIVEFSRTITGMFKSMAEQKNIKLSFYNEIDSLNIFCDSDKIEKSLSNLLSNAFKFTQENGEVTVIISKEEQSESFPDGFVKILVIDNGAGIEENKIEHIFDPFYQVDSAINRNYEGTGIGLSLVKEFVELHKGVITVDSVVGKGTKFIIKLPLGKDNNETKEVSDFDLEEIDVQNKLLAEDCSENDGKAEDIDNYDDPNRNLTVLIAEDNPDVRSYIKQFIENEYIVIEAVNGEEGYCKAKKYVPDLIISDVMMPKVDGFELCKKIKTDINTSHIPVILLTAKAGDKNVLQGIEYGADDYMIKPFNVEILLSRVKNLIDLRKQLQSRFKREQLLRPSEVNVSSLDDQFLKKLNKLIEENISNSEFSIENFCESFYMSRTSLFRKIKALTGESPNQFLRSFRLKRAAQLLNQKSGSITEVAFEVGFTNSAYFTKCFKEHFNQTPSEYINS